MRLFLKDEDFEAFERIIEKTLGAIKRDRSNSVRHDNRSGALYQVEVVLGGITRGARR